MSRNMIIPLVVILVVKCIQGYEISKENTFAPWGNQIVHFLDPDIHLSYKSNCPCTFENPYLQCDNRSLTLMPTACFSLFQGIGVVDLDLNFLTEISATAFDAVSESVNSISLTSNWITYIHPNAFSKLLQLTWLDLSFNPITRLPEYMLFNNAMMSFLNLQYCSLNDLPRTMFSPNVFNNVSIYAHPNNFISVPCSFISLVPVVYEQDLFNFTLFWAASGTEMNSCKSFGLPIYVSNCRPYGTYGIDCSVLSEPLTPKKASMAISECATNYFYPSQIMFKAELDRLKGKAPDPFECLPSEFDMTRFYNRYYRHSADIVIESFYFDLLDLPMYTSGSTTSVTIRGDTVVLTGPLQPLHFPLTIIARQIVLEYPLLMSVNLDTYAPDVSTQFYVPVHERGKVGKAIVEKLQHGLVTILLLQGEIDVKYSCQILPDWTDIVEDWVQPSQLWLSLYCASNILERKKFPGHVQVEEMADFVADITTDWTKAGHIGVNQNAVQLLQEANMLRQSYHSAHEVPYLTISIYGEMLSYLNENLQLYNEAMNNLKLKLEVNAQRMFDTSVGFSERMNDLNFLKTNARDAVEKAQAILGAHSNQLDALYLQTNDIWASIIDVCYKLNNSKVVVEAAQARVDGAMETFIRSRRFLSFLDYATLVVDITLGAFDPLLFDISLTDVFMDIVMPVGEFLNPFTGSEREIAQMAAEIDELMAQVNAIIALAPPEPPSKEDMTDWLQSFKDTEDIIRVSTNFSVSNAQWQQIRETCMIALDDKELSYLVDGVSHLKVAIHDLTFHGQTLSELIVVFSKLVISINEQLNVVEDEKDAVRNSEEALSEALALINGVILTEENYRDYMVPQNIAFAKLMAQLYLKSRSDLLAAFNVLGDYCNAYFYTFMIDCPITPSYTDDYSSMLYKLQQVDVLGLNAIESLEPPPQPFQMTFSIFDNTDENFCKDLIEGRCPVTQLALTGRTSVMLSDYWGTELKYMDRIRIDSLRLYLLGLNKPDVTLVVNRPRLFNDTWRGDVLEFTGHVTSCLIIYQDSLFQGVDDANFITDCSTHHLYDEYYYRSTPYGIFSINWSGFETGTNNTELQSIQVKIEGSWIPSI